MKKLLVMICAVLFLAAFVSAEDTAAADRFVTNHDGTVTDTQTGLMWADRDNGGDINWIQADSYCKGYGGGKKSGWRMPTLDELAQLHATGAYGYGAAIVKNGGRSVWASETRGSSGANFHFVNGERHWYRQSFSNFMRAIPVRSGK